MQKLRQILWIVLQCTWCLPQNLAGLCMALALRKHEHMRFQGAYVTAWRFQGCTSMGCFIFMQDKAMQHRPLLVHEYGHTIQSLSAGDRPALRTVVPAAGVPALPQAQKAVILPVLY